MSNEAIQRRFGMATGAPINLSAATPLADATQPAVVATPAAAAGPSDPLLPYFTRYLAEPCDRCASGAIDADCEPCSGTGYTIRSSGECVGSLALLPGLVAERLRRIVAEDAQLPEPVLEEGVASELVLLARFAERDHDVSRRAIEKLEADLDQLGAEYARQTRELAAAKAALRDSNEFLDHARAICSAADRDLKSERAEVARLREQNAKLTAGAMERAAKGAA